MPELVENRKKNSEKNRKNKKSEQNKIDRNIQQTKISTYLKNITHSPPSPPAAEPKRRIMEAETAAAAAELTIDQKLDNITTICANTSHTVNLLMQTVAGVEAAVVNLDARTTKVEERLDGLAVDNADIRKRLEKLEAENRDLKMDLAKEATKRDSIENQGRKYMLEFSGVPEADNETSEDCKKICAKVLALAGYNDALATIDLAHRKMNKSIICLFKERSLARKAYAVRFNLKGKTSENIPGFEDIQGNELYINESLTFDRSIIRAQMAAKCKILNHGKPKDQWIKVSTSDGELKCGVGKKPPKCPTIKEFDRMFPNDIQAREFRR